MKISRLLTSVTLMGAICLGGANATAKSKSLSYNYSRALEEVERGNNQLAIEFFAKELADHPKDGYAYMAMASLLFDTSAYGDARDAVESAIKYVPKRDKSSRALLHRLRSQLHTIGKDTISAYADLAQAIKLNPDDIDAYEKRGQLYFEQNRYDESDADYTRLLALEPGGVMGDMGLGRNAFYRKDYAGALAHYDKIVALNAGDYSSGYSFRAETYLAMGEYLKAIDDICKALEINSDNKAYRLLYDFPADQTNLVTAKLRALAMRHPYTGEYKYYAGQILNSKRRYEESNAILEEALEIEQRREIFGVISDNYAQMGDYATALSIVERGLEIDPDDTPLLIRRADIFGESGDLEGAIAEWSRVIDLNPDFFYGYYRRGWFEDNAEKNDEALADYEMAITLNPTYAYSYTGKGDVLLRKGENEKAEEAYAKVLELEMVPEEYSCAMYALLALGRRDEAVEYLEKVIATDVEDPGNYYDAACFTCLLGDPEKAMSYLQTALEKGYRRIAHVRHDDDLAPVRAMPEFEEMIRPYEEKVSVVTRTRDAVPDSEAISLSDDIEIPFIPTGGVTEVSCTINDLPLKFIFDTGASTVSLSMVEANFMMKNGYLKHSDVVGSQNFFDANGDISEGTVINLRKIDFGGLKLDNVRASVVRNQKAPLLLGQTVLGRLGKIEIDNTRRKLIITPRTTSDVE